MADSAEQAVVVAATKRSGKPQFHVMLSLGIAAIVLILGFQNCAVDMLASTPGASTLGACAAAPTQALVDIETVITGVIQTQCSTCHGVNSGTVKSGFYAPDATANAASTDVQLFAYTQLCVRGGETVGLKIDGSNSHVGGSFSRSGPAAALFSFLTTHF